MKTWQNLPNTSTPINADNLNRIPYCITAIRTNIETVESGNKVTLQTSISNGTGLVLEDGAIVVKDSSIKKVMVSAKVWYTSNASQVWLAIYKGNISQCEHIDQSGKTYYDITIAPKIIEVSLNDKITIGVKGSNPSYEISVNNGSSSETYLTVQEVE